jgi:hypothetical protein
MPCNQWSVSWRPGFGSSGRLKRARDVELLDLVERELREISRLQ